MIKAAKNLQDMFLNNIRKDKIPVIIHLTNGFQLKGTVKGFDSFVIFFNTNDNKQMMIYKHAVSTVTTLKHVSTNFEENEN